MFLGESQPDAPEHSGAIIVKVRRSVSDPEGTLGAISGCPVEPLIASMTTDELRALEDATDDPNDESLVPYWRVDAREIEDSGWEEMRARLEADPSVESAYLEASATDPMEPYEPLQSYLKAASEGVDANYGWTQYGAANWGLGFIDLEQGWYFEHEDMPAQKPLPHVPGDVNTSGLHRDHGTAVTTIVMAPRNGKGIAGVTSGHSPKGSNIFTAASHYREKTNSSGHVASAIMGVVRAKQQGHIKDGSVLLLEVQRHNVATETDHADYLAITKAVRKGLVVVEAAGNGNKDLDGILRGDSGAIIVGASRWNESTGQHERWVPVAGKVGSCFGKRVDAFGIGSGAVAGGFGSLSQGNGPNDRYTKTFGGTSAAAAIVAGAAVLIQNLRQSKGKSPLRPDALRKLLRSYGTPSVGADWIGRMPDMKQIVPHL